VKSCVEQLQALGARTIVSPLIGSSINPRVESDDYIRNDRLRVEHIERRTRSLKGIIFGIGNANAAPGAFGIIVWDKDVRRVIAPEFIENKLYRKRYDKSGFWGLRRRLQGVLMPGNK